MTQISFAVTAKLISVFVFATRIVQSLYFLNPKFQASSHLLWLYSLVCVRPGQKPRKPVFSQRGSYGIQHIFSWLSSPSFSYYFRQLQDLFATNNRIHDLSCIPNVVPKLEVLDLSENEISDWDEMVGGQHSHEI